MEKTKLVDLFKGFSAEDLRQLQKMVRSPFFTTNENLLALFNLLRSCHPDFNTKKLENEKVFHKLFPKHRYSDIKLRNLRSDLVGIIEDYLIYKEIKLNNFERNKKLLKVYKEKGYADLFNSTLKKLNTELEAKPYRDHVYYRHKLDLKLLELEQEGNGRLDIRYQSLLESDQMLENYYLLSKARYRLSIKGLEKYIKKSDKKEIGEEEEQTEILLSLYQQFEKLYDGSDLELFESLKKEFESNIHLIRPNFQLEFLSLLINFAIKQMAVNDEKYNKVVLGLYKIGLKNKIIFTADRVSDIAFYNIVVCGAKAKDFDWTWKFIHTYEKELALTTKVGFKTISLSIYYFHKEEFSKAVDLIVNHDFKHTQLERPARTHSVRCCYERYLQDSTCYDLLISQIDSFERYARRHSDKGEERLVSRLNFFSFIKKLATKRLSGKLNSKEQTEMVKELAKQEIILSRSWLLEIIKR